MLRYAHPFLPQYAVQKRRLSLRSAAVGPGATRALQRLSTGNSAFSLAGTP